VCVRVGTCAHARVLLGVVQMYTGLSASYICAPPSIKRPCRPPSPAAGHRTVHRRGCQPSSYPGPPKTAPLTPLDARCPLPLPPGIPPGFIFESWLALRMWRTTTGSDTTMKALGPNTSLNTPPDSRNLRGRKRRSQQRSRRPDRAVREQRSGTRPAPRRTPSGPAPASLGGAGWALGRPLPRQAPWGAATASGVRL
jgi:hypothetical protein